MNQTTPDPSLPTYKDALNALRRSSIPQLVVDLLASQSAERWAKWQERRAAEAAKPPEPAPHPLIEAIRSIGTCRDSQVGILATLSQYHMLTTGAALDIKMPEYDGRLRKLGNLEDVPLPVPTQCFVSVGGRILFPIIYKGTAMGSAVIRGYGKEGHNTFEIPVADLPALSLATPDEIRATIIGWMDNEILSAIKTSRASLSGSIDPVGDYCEEDSPKTEAAYESSAEEAAGP